MDPCLLPLIHLIEASKSGEQRTYKAVNNVSGMCGTYLKSTKVLFIRDQCKAICTEAYLGYKFHLKDQATDRQRESSHGNVDSRSTETPSFLHPSLFIRHFGEPDQVSEGSPGHSIRLRQRRMSHLPPAITPLETLLKMAGRCLEPRMKSRNIRNSQGPQILWSPVNTSILMPPTLA